jgi:peptidoglycan glycosyltransferase
VGTLFIALFALLIARQLWLALIAGPALQADSRNPRSARVAAGRGSIVASDGTPLAVTRDGKRMYPFGSTLAHAVGYASTRYGTFGLEDAFDRVLSAPHQSADSLQAAFEMITGTHLSARGSDIVTTLDVDVQRALVTALAPYARGAGIVLDPRSGAVLALASMPSFDPNTLDRQFATLAANTASPLLDRAISGLYPPGSTFKIVTAADALDAGVVTPLSTFEDSGGFRIGSFIVHNDEEERTGRQSLVGAFALSSNVDFAQVALDLGVDRWFAYAKRWGLGDSLEFDLPAARDRLPSPAEVSPSILAQLGFGQASLLVTPLRMALVAATIANAGSTPRPFLVRTIAAHNATVTTRPETLAQPIAEQTAAQVRDMMIAVVQRGTGTAAALANVTVAGKTGTATNPHGKSHAWFVAFAPAQAPRVAVAVVVENVGYGGAFAAPIARRVLRVALAKGRS